MPTKETMQSIIKADKLFLASLLLCAILSGSGCSSYTTNTDIEFDSIALINQEPAIYVGEITETADKLTFLGSVEAEVKKRNIFDEDPTVEQANIVLAYLAKQKGADAVTHVTYKTGIAGRRLVAKGQAVKINTTNTYNMKKDSIQKALEKFGLDPNEPIQSTLPAQTPNTSTEDKFNQLTSDQRLSNERVIALAKALAEAEAKAEEKVEAAKAAEEFAQLDAMADIDQLTHMVSSIEYLIKVAKEHGDEDIYNMATILKRHLVGHLEKHQRNAKK